MTYHLEQLLSEIIQQSKRTIGSPELPSVEVANSKFNAEYAVPCFKFARELAKNPQAIAQDVAKKLAHPGIAKVEATAGFVNLWLEPAYLVSGLWQDLENLRKNGKTYGEHDDGKDKTAIVEFPSPNMAKPFSVGHLRPALQGWAMTRLMKAMGYTVVTDNHLGDWGTPFGKWVVGFRRYSSDEQLVKDGIYELARVYIQITADLKAEKEADKHELASEVQSWLLKLEKGDSEAKSYSERFAVISLKHMHHVMDRLGIKTDYEYGEAFYIPEGKRMVNKLVEQGIAERQVDGSVIVRLDEYGIETPVLLEKSNGAALYATSDMAMLKFRAERWHPTKTIITADAGQQLHFRQIFALADKLGYKGEYVHYWFGVIDQIHADGTRGKMSSRKGTVLLEELLDIAEQEARKHAADPSALTDQAVKQVALGAIKFTEFSQDKKTNILFDWDRMFSLQGFSGPYVQYAAVRVGAILRKFGAQPWQDSSYNWQAEQPLLLHLARYPQIIKEAAELYEPHRVAGYLYDLARILNRYYETTPVGTAPESEKSHRLWLLSVVRDNFEHALGLLGIEVPEKM